MSTIDEELEDKKDEKTEVKGGKSFIEKIVTADSSTKPIDSFKSHALNWDGKTSTARIIKGLEGMLGNLDKAIIDVLVGTIQKVQEFTKSIKKEE